MLSAVRRLTTRRVTPVERYWSRHTVKAIPFATADESARDLEWRFGQYPLFRELMDLWGSHDDQTILDYGCGPGNDVTGFLVHTGASRVVGVDISEKALGLAASRLALHGIDPERHRLLRLSEAEPELPLADGSADYVHCAGVIQHTTDPERVLRELARTLRPGGSGRIMVYNRDSLYFHLYTAYERRVLQGLFGGLTPEEAFARNTDGPKCPVSRAFLAGRVLQARARGRLRDRVQRRLLRRRRAGSLRRYWSPRRAATRGSGTSIASSSSASRSAPTAIHASTDTTQAWAACTQSGGRSGSRGHRPAGTAGAWRSPPGTSGRTGGSCCA